MDIDLVWEVGGDVDENLYLLSGQLHIEPQENALKLKLSQEFIFFVHQKVNLLVFLFQLKHVKQ